MRKNGNVMSVTIHSRSILDAISRQDEAAFVLLKCHKAEKMDFLMTPTSMIVPEEVRKINQMKYVEYVEHPEGFVVEISTEDRLTRAFCRKQISTGWPKELFGYEPNDINAVRIIEAFKDICAHEILRRDLFVTEDSDILSKKSWIEKQFDVKIVSALEALERMDLFLKQHEIYYVNPDFNYGKLGYYWFLTKDLLPAFRETWWITVSGEEVIPNGKEILSHLQSFSSRFENLLAARDKIGIEFFKVPNNLTAWEMFYHLNYFVVLVTGLFDSLAWITKHRYSMDLKKLYVELKIEPEKQSSEFVRSLKAYNPQLSAFLVDEYNKSLVLLFYPMRDSIQHKELLENVVWSDTIKGLKFVGCFLKPDAEKAIKAVDKIIEDRPFSLWGIYQRLVSILEPYTFVQTSLKEVSKFCNIYLQKLNFNELLQSRRDILDRVAEGQKWEEKIEKERRLTIRLGRLLFGQTYKKVQVT